MLEFRRIESIDLTRGLVIVLMALDHTRDFFSEALFSPTDLDRTTPGYFLTRWITHLCAPTFVFLTGVSAWLSTKRRALSRNKLAAHLVIRGLWLVMLEVTLVRFGWLFNWNFQVVFAQVIWVLGWSMTGLAAVLYCPRPLAGALALALTAGHNGLDPVDAGLVREYGGAWMILHVPGTIEWLPGHVLHVVYPLLPWLGVMLAGYWCGPYFLRSPAARQTLFFRSGLALFGLFLLLRLGNLYGDPKPWHPWPHPWQTVFAVLDCRKYPPSLLYLLMTLGLMLLLLAGFESRQSSPLRRPLRLFGQTPLFFYLLHLPLLHGAALAVARFRGLPAAWLLSGDFPTVPTPEYGFSLPAVYGFWLAFLFVLHPVCQGFADYKYRHPEFEWLRYL